MKWIRVNTVVDHTGDIKYEGSLLIKGTVQGDVEASGDVHLHRKAKITGRVRCRHFFNSGKVIGDITCSLFLNKSGGSFVGSMASESLILLPGSEFEGDRFKSIENNT